MSRKLLFGGWAQPVEAKTAAYTVKSRDCGKIFTNRGASGSVTFTLPKIDADFAGMTGFNVEFYSVAAQDLVVASDPSDSLIVDSDATADSITMDNVIGQHLRVVCDGTGWLVIANPSGASAATGGATNPRAYTIATA